MAARAKEFEQDRVEDHRECKAEHREIDAAEAGKQNPERSSAQRRYDDRQRQREKRLANAEPVREETDGIGPDRKVERMAKRDQAAAQEQHDAEHDGTLGERERDEKDEPIGEDERQEREHAQRRDGCSDGAQHVERAGYVLDLDHRAVIVLSSASG